VGWKLRKGLVNTLRDRRTERAQTPPQRLATPCLVETCRNRLTMRRPPPHSLLIGGSHNYCSSGPGGMAPQADRTLIGYTRSRVKHARTTCRSSDRRGEMALTSSDRPDYSFRSQRIGFTGNSWTTGSICNFRSYFHPVPRL
jgi:hypothetical protein